jgi:hypothetical protein
MCQIRTFTADEVVMAKKVFGYSTPYASCWSPSPGFQRNLRIRAFVDVFTDISPLFVINNEISW